MNTKLLTKIILSTTGISTLGAIIPMSLSSCSCSCASSDPDKTLPANINNNFLIVPEEDTEGGVGAYVPIGYGVDNSHLVLNLISYPNRGLSGVCGYSSWKYNYYQWNEQYKKYVIISLPYYTASSTKDYQFSDSNVDPNMLITNSAYHYTTASAVSKRDPNTGVDTYATGSTQFIFTFTYKNQSATWTVDVNITLSE